MALRVLFFYILYSSINDHIMVFAIGNTEADHKIHRFLLSLFTLIEFTFFSSIIASYLTGTLRRWIVYISMVGFSIFCVYTYLATVQNFDSYPASVEGILLLIFCIFYFFEQISGQPTLLMYQSHKFWVVIGIMCYTSLNFFLFLQSSNASVSIISKFWDINLVSNILKNIIFAIAFVINDENESKPIPNRHYSTF